MALGTADEDWRVASALTAALGFVSVACLWWVYFDRGMAGGLSSRTGSRQIYTRSHIPLLAALGLVVLAALAGVLTPVSLVACSAAALVALVVYEIRLRLAEQDA